eukprot:14823027-Alexandrium_andersonii.AAC.1
MGAVASAAHQSAAADWGASHEKEISFQRQKLESAKVEQGTQGTLAPAEDSQGLRRALRPCRQRAEAG